MAESNGTARELQAEALKRTRDAQWAQMLEDLARAGAEKVPLWDRAVPGFVAAHGQSPPSLSILPVHEGARRGMVIVCAGGGFAHKARHEAQPTAEYFHRRGLNTCILDYRVRPYERADAAADGLRAVRVLRSHADALGILPDKIAIAGFSAGGVLAGMTAARFDDGDPASADPVERVSSRPDAALVLYGAINPSVNGPAAGIGYDIDAQNALAREDYIKNLRNDGPPFFIFQTHADDPRLAMRLGLELGDRGIPFEVHTFTGGAHGGGLYDGNAPHVPHQPHTAHWAELAAEWLEGYGF